jgi:hypothetical protein
MPLLEMVHITAAYSNAVLVAVLPHISNFAKKIDLPIPLPITQSQVVKFRINPIKGYIGGGIFLTNHYQFAVDRGSVIVFHNLTDNPFITDGSPEKIKQFAGKDNMTLNDAIDFSRNLMVKLGYTPKELQADIPPFSAQDSFNMPSGEHIPYCDIRWDNEKNITNNHDILSMDFQIDMERKQLVGMGLVGRVFWKTNPPVNVTPELESDFRKRMQNTPHATMYFNTNAPAQFNQQ